MASISGETLRGFVMPRSSPFPLVAGLEVVARVVVRTMRRLAGNTGWKPCVVEVVKGKENVAVSEEMKVEMRLVDIAIVVVSGCSDKEDKV